jgi:hypothetical protein
MGIRMLNTSRFRLASFNKQPQSISRKPQLVQTSIGTPRTAPLVQYVITLSGTLEFTTRDGETFVLRPGEVLLAADTTGTGHRWRLVDNQPWRRLYVELRLTI